MKRLALIGLLVAWPLAALAMEFELGSHCEDGICRPALIGKGGIDSQSPARFERATANAADVSLVVLSSHGGNLGGGLKLGHLFRQRRLETRIEGDCFSACAYAFLGGVTRIVPEGARLGVHQFRGDEKVIDAANAQKISAILGRYLDTMGVDRRFLDVALVTASDQVSVLDVRQLAALRVDTRYLAPVRWRLEATDDGSLYAVINQLVPGVAQPLTIGMTRQSGAWRLIVMVKKSPAAMEMPAMGIKLSVAGQAFELPVLMPWKNVKDDARQLWLDVPPAVLPKLLALSDKDYFELEQSGSATAVLPKTIRLGGAGLRNALNALRRAAGVSG